MNKLQLQLSFQEFSLVLQALRLHQSLTGSNNSESIQALACKTDSGLIELTQSQYCEVMCALKYYVDPGQDMIVSDETIDIVSNILTRNGITHTTKGGEKYKELLNRQRLIAKLKVNKRFNDFVEKQYDGSWSKVLRKIRNADELTQTEEEIAREYQQINGMTIHETT